MVKSSIKVKEWEPVYPDFQSKLECLVTLVNFKKGEFYYIEGFGKGKGGVNVWYIEDLSNPKLKFVVMKETMRKMFRDNKIKYMIEKEKGLDI